MNRCICQRTTFLKEESVPTEDYPAYFYPFDKPDFKKNGVESGWTVTGREGIAITMAMGSAPQAVAMGLQKEYVERYDWLVKEFTDWAFTFMTSFLYIWIMMRLTNRRAACTVRAFPLSVG